MNDAEFQKLLHSPAPVALIVSLPKFLLRILFDPLAVLLLLGVMYVVDDEGALNVFLGIIIFGLSLRFIFMVVCLPKFKQYRLILNDEFFTEQLPPYQEGKSRSWKDVTEFKAGIFNNVHYDYLPDLESQYPDDASRSLYDIANVSAKQLATLMNHWRKRAIDANN